jgi:hypothetical protein
MRIRLFPPMRFLGFSILLILYLCQGYAYSATPNHMEYEHATNKKMKTSQASKDELEKLGITVVTTPDGKNNGLVASLLQDELVYKLTSLLEKADISWFTSCDLAICGIYVPVGDFYRAQDLLLKERARFNANIWVWEPSKN